MADDSDLVILVSQDGEPFNSTYGAVKHCETLKSLIEDVGTEIPIPLPEIRSTVLDKIVTFLEHHEKDSTEIDKTRTDDISKWVEDFLNIENDMLFALLQAANYVSYPLLLAVVCKKIANKIKGKTPEQIRAEFGIKTDFTEEEKAAVLKEEPWADPCI